MAVPAQAVTLISYDFKIIYVRGIDNGRVDALSRKAEHF